MAGTLQSRLSDLALLFSEGVLDAIRGASIAELFGESGARRPGATRRDDAPATKAAPSPRPGRRGAGRLSRRSPADIERIVNEIVALLGNHPAGLRAEEIREGLGLVAKELPRPLNEALSAGLLGKSGQKRATTYFVKGGASKAAPAAESGSAPAKPAGRRKAKKAAKKAKPAKRAARKGRSKAASSARRKAGRPKRKGSPRRGRRAAKTARS
jgi:hypothetical protein